MTDEVKVDAYGWPLTVEEILRDQVKSLSAALRGSSRGPNCDRDGCAHCMELAAEHVARLEAALRGVLVCREWEHRGAALEDLLPAEFAAADEALRALESAGAVQTNVAQGAVSVVKPQGTEETGTDRPAAPVSKEGYCELCGEPMPPGETMFRFHGYSGPCPAPRQRDGLE